MGTITTFTGIDFTPLSPRLEDIDIKDIAHALSNLCRFTGHTPVFYSVAEHSVLVSNLVEPKYALGALLHDASEAYLNDIAGPVKPFFPEYVKAEAKLQDLINLKWTIGGDEQFAAIKAADMQALKIEQSIFFTNRDPKKIVTFFPLDAERLFIDRFYQLTEKTPEKDQPRAYGAPLTLGPFSYSISDVFHGQPRIDFPVGEHSTAEVLEEMDRRYNTKTPAQRVDSVSKK